MAILIAKSDGTQEPYNPAKLVASLLRSGAEHGVAEQIAHDIANELRTGITTQEIYRRAFTHLRESKHAAAARYSLKRALLEFGPSGFPFESYLAHLFEIEGYKTKINQMVKGVCVEHEIDVLIKNKSGVVFVEAKFHNAAGFKTDLKTALYVKARLEDILSERMSRNITESMRGMIVTNTKFSSEAAKFAACAGVELLGWEEPLGATLRDRIDRAGLYPVTALTTLNRREKMALLGQKVVLCSQIAQDTRALSSVGVGGDRAQKVLQEVGLLCVPGGHIE